MNHAVFVFLGTFMAGFGAGFLVRGRRVVYTQLGRQEIGPAQMVRGLIPSAEKGAAKLPEALDGHLEVLERPRPGEK